MNFFPWLICFSLYSGLIQLDNDNNSPLKKEIMEEQKKASEVAIQYPIHPKRTESQGGTEGTNQGFD